MMMARWEQVVIYNCDLAKIKQSSVTQTYNNTTGGIDLEYDRTLQATSAVDCNSSPLGSSILTENVVVGDGNL
jgi:hypothetical protein